MTADAMALASDIAKKVARSRASPADKFDALVAVLSAMGVPDEIHLQHAEKIIRDSRK